jgi:hypothetical protein
VIVLIVLIRTSFRSLSIATMSNQVATTSAEEMVEMLSLLEEGYGAQLQNGRIASPGSTPRSDASAGTPTRQTEAMQRLKELAKGVQTQFNFVRSYLMDDRSGQSESREDGAFP